MKQKLFFIISTGLSVAKYYVRHDSAPLITIFHIYRKHSLTANNVSEKGKKWREKLFQSFQKHSFYIKFLPYHNTARIFFKVQRMYFAKIDFLFNKMRKEEYFEIIWLLLL